MKHHRTKRYIAIKKRGRLAREVGRLPDKGIHNIAKKDRWMLDLDPSNEAVMSKQELQHSVF